MSNLVGQTLGGKYQIIERLGRGGMAEVYKAYQLKLERYVAIKVMHAFLADEMEFLGRFEREAKNVAALRHPHIVQLYDFDIQEGQPYMVMEFVEGPTLKTYLQMAGRPGLALEELWRIGKQTAEALVYAHERGMIHRDIKPANILLNREREAILTDFGIAKILAGPQYTQTGALIGTPTYMSPELIRGEKGDIRSDIYALGVVLYELLSGRPPFMGEMNYEVVMKHLTELPPALSDFVTDVPALLQEIILKMLAKNPTDRYQTLHEVVTLFQSQTFLPTADLQIPLPPQSSTTAPPTRLFTEMPTRPFVRPQDLATEREKILQAIAALESQRLLLGNEVIESGLAPLRARLANLEPQTIVEHRKQVTILVAQLSGLGTLSGELDAEDWRDWIVACYAQWMPAIAQHHGTAERALDGSLIGIFGAPIASENDPENAIRAALTVRDTLDNLKTKLPSRLHPHLAIKIGIDSGRGLVSLLGQSQGETVTVVGNTMNLATRLQREAPDNTILISHNTYQLVRGLFEVQKLALPTIPSLATVYAVKQAQPRAFRLNTRGIEGVQTRMVGREAELRRLQDTLYDMLDYRQMQVVTILGEAGVGKSRLLDEFHNWLKRESAEILCFPARADQQTSQTPYALIRYLLLDNFGISDSDPSQQAREKFVGQIQTILGLEAIGKAHFIGYLLGLDFSDSDHLKGILQDAQQIRDRAFNYLTQLVQTLAQQNPVVIYLDDLHWADDGSLDLVAHLVRTCAHSRLLILALSRPTLYERRPMWGEGDGAYSRLELLPLSRRDIQRLIVQILGKLPALPDSLRDLILNGSDGNPFYVEELIKMLIDDGVIVPAEGEWSLNRQKLINMHVPASLTEIIQARLDSLPSIERETLQRASVVGQIFWDKAVSALQPLRDQSVVELPAELQPIFNQLRRRELILGRESSAFAQTQEYLFKHAISHDVTYDSLVKRLRRAYHAQIAHWLIQNSGDRVAEFAERIGGHFVAAEEAEPAAHWYSQAGDQARDTYLPQAAIGHYEKALHWLPDLPAFLPQKLILLENLGEMLIWQARYADAILCFEKMQNQAEKEEKVPAQTKAWIKLAEIAYRQSDMPTTITHAQTAITLAQQTLPVANGELAEALHWEAVARLRLGESMAALAIVERCLQINRDLNRQQNTAASLNFLGVIYGTIGQLTTAEAQFQQALVLLRSLGNLRRAAIVSNNLGAIAERRGDYAEAAQLFREAHHNHSELGDQGHAQLALTNLGMTLVEMSQYSQGEKAIRQVLANVEPNWLYMPDALRGLALACLGQNKVPEALTYAEQSLTTMLQRGMKDQLGHGWRTVGMTLAKSPHPQLLTIAEKTVNPRDCFTESIHLFEEMKMEIEQARTLRAWAIYEWQQKESKKGKQLWQQAKELFIKTGLTQQAAQMGEVPS